MINYFNLQAVFFEDLFVFSDIERPARRGIAALSEAQLEQSGIGSK